MSFKKLFAAMRGGVNEATEALVDTQAIRILDQEMRDANKELVACNRSLTTIMAKRKLADQKVASVNAGIEEYTNHAIAASTKGDEALALECAEKVSSLEVELSTETDIRDQYVGSEKTLKANIAKAKTSVQRMEQQIEQVKANAAVQKAQEASSIHHVGANSKIKTAVDSLERIKAKQAQRSAELESAEELAQETSSSDLDARLKQAGITPGGKASGSDKLAELLAKRSA